MIFSTDPVGILRAGNGNFHSLSHLITLMTYSILFLVSQLSLSTTLHHFSTALPVAFSYFPRNLLLLIGGGITTGAQTQMTLILALQGCGALLYADDELYALLSKRLGGSDDENYEVLPTSSSLVSPSPSIPPSQSPPPSSSSYVSYTTPSITKVTSNRLVYLTFLPLLIYLLRHPTTTT